MRALDLHRRTLGIVSPSAVTLVSDGGGTGTNGFVAGDGTYNLAPGSLHVGVFFNTKQAWYHLITNIPTNWAGKTIVSAILTLPETPQTAGTAGSTVFADKTASPTIPTSLADYNAKTTTTASVPWSITSTGTGTFTKDIASVIQELVNAFGNTITGIDILHKGTGADTGYEFIADNSTSAATHCPSLVVTYQ